MIGPLLPMFPLSSSGVSFSPRQLPHSDAPHSSTISNPDSSFTAPAPMASALEAMPPRPPRSSGGKVEKAIYATSAAVVVITVTFILFLFRKKLRARFTKRGRHVSSFRREDVVVPEEFNKCSRKIRGLVVDENGTDVIYMTNLEEGQLKTDFPRVIYNPSFEFNQEEEKRVDTTSPGRVNRSKELQSSAGSGPPPPPLIPTERLSTSSPTPPPPPPPPPPTGPVMPAKKHPPPPPPLKIARGSTSTSSVKLPNGPRSAVNNRTGTGTGSGASTSFARLKLKPLHWDKIIANNAEHSLVWDQIKDGSLRFDDEQMETLFGYTPIINGQPSHGNASRSDIVAPQIFILEPRKSQNIAIVLKSLPISWKEIVDALQDGQGLNTETLEKLIKVAPTEEEQAKILHFNGETRKLAVAEMFLYHVLQAVPSAFTRLNAMLFRQSYGSEILHLKESLETLESACKELRNRGLFFKLLEAILKAGNRMNAGTSRGNAQGFNLTALQKLSDVKSTDGRTTLLHFVVEQVARSEGRRLLSNRNVSPGSLESEEKEREYLVTGLRVLGALRAELSSVKTAATIEEKHLSNTCSFLMSRVSEIRELVPSCGNGERREFVSQMKVFLEECEEEIKSVGEEQRRVMELVKRTTEYYQARSSKGRGANLLQIFVIVKDFLNMVERVQGGITKNLQGKSGGGCGSASPPPPPPPLKRSDFPVKLSNNFRWQMMSETSTSESEDDWAEEKLTFRLNS